MKNEITISKITSLNKRMYRCGVEVQDFEKEFINSLIKNAKYCKKGVKIYGDVTDSCNANIVLYLSEKQITIFERIKIRYKNAYDNRCAYYIYSQVIEDYEINLEKFDRDTLKTFKGEKESEESKEWMRQIMLYR
jgi:hypothetical protein